MQVMAIQCTAVCTIGKRKVLGRRLDVGKAAPPWSLSSSSSSPPSASVVSSTRLDRSWMAVRHPRQTYDMASRKSRCRPAITGTQLFRIIQFNSCIDRQSSLRPNDSVCTVSESY